VFDLGLLMQIVVAFSIGLLVVDFTINFAKEFKLINCLLPLVIAC
jgi:hypothetical protein